MGAKHSKRIRWEVVQDIHQKTGFTSAQIKKLKANFLKASGGKNLMSRSAFEEAMKTAGVADDKEFLVSLFNEFDLAKSGKVNFKEFCVGLHMFENGNLSGTLEGAFEMFDLAGNDVITKHEMERTLIAIVKTLNLTAFSGDDDLNADESITLFVNEVFDQSDSDRSGALSFDQFVDAVRHHPFLLEAASDTVSDTALKHFLKPARLCHAASMDEVSTRHVFLIRAFKRILKACGRKQEGIRTACNKYLEQVNEEVKLHKANPDTYEASDVDKYFEPFRLGCESTVPDITVAALDCLQKLIAYGYLSGRTTAADAPGMTLMDTLIETVCACFDTHKSEEVHLQIIKALLTAVTSSSCDVHEVSLLMAVRTCYNVYLVSSSVVNQTTAKGALSQMLNLIFQRMEAAPASEALAAPSAATRANEQAGAPTAVMSPGVFEQAFGEARDDDTASPVTTPSAAPGGALHSVAAKEEEEEPVKEEAVKEEAVEAVGAPPSSSEQRSHNIAIQLPRSPEHSPHASPRGGIAHAFASGTIPSSSFANVMQKDAFLVFRALCKISMKEGEGPAESSIVFKSKVLSLELLLSVLENAGETFRTGDIFILSVKQYLCPSLIKNCMSTVPAVVKLSLNIFVALINHYVYHLKSQVGVFFNNIFFLIENPNSTYEQKMMVLHVFHKLALVPQTVVDLFLNYDCDVHAVNVFQRMVTNVAKLSQGSHVHEGWISPPQVAALKTVSVQVLSTITESMAKWLERLNDAAGGEDAAAAGEDGAGAVVGGSESTPDTPASGVVAAPRTPQRVSSSSTAAADESGALVAAAAAAATSLDGDTAATASPAQQFEQRKQYKVHLEEGIRRFNLKAKKGIAYLVESGTVQHTTEQIAELLLNTEGFNKTMIGEYIGEGKDFNVGVLHAMIDLMDFTGMRFEHALRHLLAAFRLPGEAQKIDRIVEKFAERFTVQNDDTGIFATADTAFVLAYSVIMLHTDAHNPMVKNKMTKDEFVRNNRGINDGRDLPADYLGALYDNIVAHEIKMSDDVAWGNKNAMNTFLSPKKRSQMYAEESARLVRDAQRLFRDSTTATADAASVTTYYCALHGEHVRPMFEIACWPMLASFSVLLEQSEDERIISLCLRGFKNCVHISARFYLDTERDAFVTALNKFTLLHSVHDMRPKSVESIKTMLQIAAEHGNYLQSSWTQVFHCISTLEQLQVFGVGGPGGDGGGGGGGSGAGGADMAGMAAGGHHQQHGGGVRKQHTPDSRRSFDAEQLRALDSYSQQLVDQIDPIAIDRIFTSSVRLSGEAIVDFVRCLCEVSTEELAAPVPRMYSLQKLVELTYYNMGRIRLVWGKLWRIIGDHFVQVGCRKDLSISMYAIDSLRQLAVKFLEKDELSLFQFQKEFLQPFDTIMESSEDVEIRELVVRCLTQMVMARAKNIKSGWRTMFQVLSNASADAYESIVQLGFETVERIANSHFEMVTDTFVDMVNCFSAYASNRHSIPISIRAIEHVHMCARWLSQGRVPACGAGADDATLMRFWFPILTGLSRVVIDAPLPVRTKALEVLFSVIKSSGSVFSAKLWDMIFRGVLFPIFDDVAHIQDEHTSPQAEEWLQTTCLAALRALIDLFSSFYSTLATLLDDVLDLLASCILQEKEAMARIGVTCLTQLVLTNGDKLDDAVWSGVCTRMDRLFARTSPEGQLNMLGERALAALQPKVGDAGGAGGGSGASGASGGDSGASGGDSGAPPAGQRAINVAVVEPSTEFNRVRCKCVVQLLLIASVKDMLAQHFDRLSTQQHEVVLALLHRSYTVAKTFNNNMDLRMALWNGGYMNQLPNLLKQESHALRLYLETLFRLFSQGRVSGVEEKLFPTCRDLLEEYLKRDERQSDEQREVMALTPIVVIVVSGFARLQPAQLRAQLRTFYPLFTRLIISSSKDVHAAVCELFRGGVEDIVMGALA